MKKSYGSIVISFMGVDGSGKSTQIAELAKWLNGSDLKSKNNQLILIHHYS